MLSSKLRLAALSIAVASSAWLSAGPALAALPLVVSSQQALDGIHEYSTVTVKNGGRIVVRPSSVGLGWLHLRANTITIESGGEIDATGAGYQGSDGSDGGQPSGSSGAGKLAGGDDTPGTGGANAGDGGRGTTAACSPIAAPPGGVAYAMAGSLELGSAGGAAKVTDPSLPTRGGHGGGRITLEAALITISGVVAARGEDGLNPSNIGSGGGAGGVLQLIGGSMNGAGIVSVRGGAGGTGTQNGGGGGGGLVLLSTSTPAAMLTISFDLDGGPSGMCAMAGKGGQGSLIESPIAACVDADKDGFNAAACGGDDCDDADPEIHPAKSGVSVLERCDAQDNDCNGSVDDDLPPGACPEGTCQAGVCVPNMTGDGGGSNVGPRPDHVEYIGGCSFVRAGGDDETAGRGGEQAGRALAVLGALVFARRQRRGRSQSTSAPRRARATPLDAGTRKGQTGRSVRASRFNGGGAAPSE